MHKQSIGDFVDVILDKADGTKLPYVEIGDIDISTKKYSLKDKPAVDGALKANKDCVLISKVRPTRGAVSIVQNDCYVSNAFVILRARQALIPEFLFYSIAYDNNFFSYLGRLEKGTSYPSCRVKDILSYKISVPSKADQDQIVKVLKQADALRQKRKQSLQLLDDFLRATFLDMFGDPLRNDKKWPVRKLGEVSSVKIGPFGSLLHRDDYIANGIPLVNPTHIVNKRICPDFNFTISDKKREELRQYLLKEGDIILARRGEIGRCGLVTKKEDGYLCGTGSLFVRPQKALNPIYLVYLISSKSMRKSLENSSVGVTMKNLNAGVVENTNIIHPDKKLQDKFEAIVSKTDSLKDSMGNSIEQMDNQFNALTQRYFG